MDIPDCLRGAIQQSDGSLEGTLTQEHGYVIIPCDSGRILLDGEWTPSQLRAIVDYAESIGIHG